jgi:hypothetical protein
LIITLSTIPPRFRYLRPTLNSLLRQEIPADAIIVYIPERYRRFPNWDGRLPDVPRGVSIHRAAIDLGPATKVLPAVSEFAGRDVDILFCDDDVIYDRKWTRRFAELRERMPGVCIAEDGKNLRDIELESRSPDRLPRFGRGRRDWRALLSSMVRHRRLRPSRYMDSGYGDVLMGCGGAMVRPEFFTEAVFDIPEILWTVDDFWLSGHLEANGVPIWINGDAPFRRMRLLRHLSALKHMVHAGYGRRAANRACIAYFRTNCGIWAPTGSPRGAAVTELADAAKPTPGGSMEPLTANREGA